MILLLYYIKRSISQQFHSQGIQSKSLRLSSASQNFLGTGSPNAVSDSDQSSCWTPSRMASSSRAGLQLFSQSPFLSFSPSATLFETSSYASILKILNPQQHHARQFFSKSAKDLDSNGHTPLASGWRQHPRLEAITIDSDAEEGKEDLDFDPMKDILPLVMKVREEVGPLSSLTYLKYEEEDGEEAAVLRVLSNSRSTLKELVLSCGGLRSWMFCFTCVNLTSLTLNLSNDNYGEISIFEVPSRVSGVKLRSLSLELEGVQVS